MINRFTKKRYYVLYIINNNNTFIESTIEMFIKKIFRLYELFVLIILNRNL